MDEAGEPVGPCLMWLDTRGAPRTREAIGGPLMGYSPRALATWIRHTGGVPSPFGGDPVSHMLHLERDEPEIAAAARWYLEPVDYLTMRFTGRAAATHASMSGAWLTDNRRLDRLEYDPVLVRKLGLDAGKLPPLVETGSMIGAVRPEVASELGISPERTGRHRDARPALGGARLRGDRRGPAAHHDQHHLVDLAAVPAQEDRRAPFDRDRPGARLEQLPRREQPRGRWALPALAARQLHPRRARRVRAADRAGGKLPAGQRRGDLHALDRGRALSGRRPQRPRRLAQPLRSRPATPTWSARCSRASPTTAAGLARPSRASPSGDSTRSASSAAARSPTSGARSTPT